ncbi:hypothetical protein LDENG_00161170 [Lucifuga dentata]|nr:hypothetical protein LDENG_00161170 [Lucifuga dentata]
MSHKLLLFSLQRCVTATRYNLSSGIRNTGRLLTSRFIQSHQRHNWTLSARTSCPQNLTQKTSQHSLCTKAEAPGEDEYPPLPAYQSESEKKEVYIIQAKGLPWSCTAEDLLQFFSECRIRDGTKGVHLTVDRLGRPVGQAFIELEHEEDISKALEKHWQYMGSRYVEVYEVTNSDAEKILKKAAQAPAKGVVRIRGLPFSCTEADITWFFSGLDIVKNGVTIVLDNKGRNSGEAFVQFSSQEIADEALQRDRKLIGNRYIEVFPCRSSEVHSGFSQAIPQRKNVSAWQENHKNAGNPRPGSTVTSISSSAFHQNPGLPQHYLHMRGLPFHATGEDIVKFFSPLGLSKILIEYGPDGRPSGEADVYFTCHQDAVAAMSRDRLHIGEHEDISDSVSQH